MTSPLRPALSALGAAAVDTERHVARLGWDQAPRMFALVRTGPLLEREPALGGQLRGSDPAGYTSIEQEGLPRTSNLESMLGRMAWPEEVDGVAIAVERIVVPPEAERDLPTPGEGGAEPAEALAAHPDRKDVRLFVAVLRDGEAICLLRQREHDSDDRVAIGSDIAPGLVHALHATLT